MKKKTKKRKILIIIITIILIAICSIFIYFKIQDYNTKKFISKIDKTKQEEIINLIVDINPSILLKVKNNTVIDSKCLNKDCEELLNKMNYNYDDNINNQNVDKIINTIYNESKNYGYDTSNGINITSSSSSAEILVNDIKEASFKKISFEEESSILENNGYNIREEQLSKEEYNNKILSELRTDTDYESAYYCDIFNGEVKCYLKDFIGDAWKEFGNENIVFDLVNLEISVEKFKRVLDKFEIEYDLESALSISKLKLKNGKTYYFQPNHSYPLNNGNNEFTDYYFGSTIYYDVKVEGNANEYGHIPILEDKSYIIPITKLDLLNHSFNEEDIIIIDYNEQTITNYYLAGL